MDLPEELHVCPAWFIPDLARHGTGEGGGFEIVGGRGLLARRPLAQLLLFLRREAKVHDAARPPLYRLPISLRFLFVHVRFSPGGMQREVLLPCQVSPVRGVVWLATHNLRLILHHKFLLQSERSRFCHLIRISGVVLGMSFPTPFGGPNFPSSHGSAKWMSAEVHRQFLVRGFNQNPGLIFGRSREGVLRYSGDGHTMLVAPPGAGKGVGFVLPNLLTYPGSMIVIDPKGENAAFTARHRAEKLGHQVYVIDPAGVSGLPSAQYNPLAWLDSSPPNSFDADLRGIAEALVPGEGMEDFWARGARVLAASLIYYLSALPDQMDLRDLYDMAHLRDDVWQDLWQRISRTQSGSPELERRARAGASWYLGLEQKHKQYHKGTLQDGLSWLVGDSSKRAVAKSSFDMRNLKSEKMTVYLCVPPLELGTYKPLARLIVDHALRSVMQRLSFPGETPVVFLLDEFANSVGSLGTLNAGFSQVRGYGGRFAVVLQSIGQLKALYPEGKNAMDWTSVEETMGNAVYFKARYETAEHVSKRLGVTTHYTPSPIGGSSSHQGPLLYPNQVSNPPGPYGQESIFAFIEGLDPLWARTLKSFSDEEFKGKYNPSAFVQKALGPAATWRQDALTQEAEKKREAPPITADDKNILNNVMKDMGFQIEGWL